MKGTDIVMALLIVSVVVCKLCHVNGAVNLLAETLARVAYPYFGVKIYDVMKGRR